MKITFPCTGCGKTLKGRPDSVGRTRKCPVCATRVTCPDPVVVPRPAEEDLDDGILEAEVVPVARSSRPAARSSAASRPAAPPPDPDPEPMAAVNPFADLDDDDPYQLAGPPPESNPATEPKKPCPACGETILASAVKCRFCGEVFDAAIKKGKPKKNKKRKSSSGGGGSGTAARDIGIGIACMGAGIGLTIATLAAAASNSTPGNRFVVFYGLILGGFIQMCRGFANMIRGG